MEVFQRFCHTSHALHTLALTKDQLDNSNALHCKNFTINVMRIGLRRCDEWIKESVWLRDFSLFHHGRGTCHKPISICCQGRAEQSRSSRAGHWTIAIRWHSNFDTKFSRKSGRPLTKSDDRLSSISKHSPSWMVWDGLRRPNFHHGDLQGSISFHIKVIFFSCLSMGS